MTFEPASTGPPWADLATVFVAAPAVGATTARRAAARMAERTRRTAATVLRLDRRVDRPCAVPSLVDDDRRAPVPGAGPRARPVRARPAPQEARRRQRVPRPARPRRPDGCAPGSEADGVERAPAHLRAAVAAGRRAPADGRGRAADGRRAQDGGR